MKNYICIGGKKIPRTKEQVCEMQKSLKSVRCERNDDIVTLSDGENSYEFIILENLPDAFALLSKDTIVDDVCFGDTNDFRGSNVEKILDEFAEKIANIVGEDNILLHNVDLTALDGLKDYGNVSKKVSLLTQAQAAKYVDTLDEYKLDKYWWLLTPWTTSAHGYNKSVLCVSPVGGINIYDSDYVDGGVRPFCILRSNIFVSE